MSHILRELFYDEKMKVFCLLCFTYWYHDTEFRAPCSTKDGYFLKHLMTATRE